MYGSEKKKIALREPSSHYHSGGKVLCALLFPSLRCHRGDRRRGQNEQAFRTETDILHRDQARWKNE